LYIQEAEKGNVSNETMESKLGLRVGSGGFSYADIALKFNTILGISGTVESMSAY